MITYRTDRHITTAQLRQVYEAAGLHRRLDESRLAAAIAGADFLLTAWDDERLVGACRGLTDYADVIYIADLAVDQTYAKQGIGRQLLQLVDELSGGDLNQVLLASAVAADYYAKVGFTKHPRGYFKAAED